jgi:transcriptional regulator with XRE-family HTH domain
MQENDFLRTEIGKLLRKAREKSGLSQTEVAKRVGLSAKTGHAYISRLESGIVKNPPLLIALLCLRVCGEPWPEFFRQLDTIDFKMRHEKMISQLPPPASQRKIQRDAMRYEIGVEFPSKEKEEIDFERLRKQFGNRVLVLLSKNQVAEKDIPSYQKFSLEYFDFLATLNKAGMKIVTDKYHRAGLKLNLLLKIKKIINSVLMGEIKRIESKKPLPTVKQEKMAIGFTKYRIKIEQIEAEVHKVLCELGVQPPWFALYKDFARECYRTLKQYYGKEILSDKLQEIIKRWVKEGLKEDVLLKVKEATIKVIESRH